MVAAAAGDPDASLSLGHPKNGGTLGTLEKAVKIFLLPALFPAGVPVAERLYKMKETCIFLLTPGKITAEYPVIAEGQTDERRKPENVADEMACKHGDYKKHTGQRTGCQGKCVRAIPPGKMTVISPQGAFQLPFK